MKIRNILFISSVAFLFSLFLAKPKIDEIKKTLAARDGLWEAIDIKKADLTSSLTDFKPVSGEAKYVFRLTVPVFMKVTHIGRYQMYGIQIFLGFLIFCLWSLIASSFLGYRDTLISTLALAGVYYGKAFNIDSGTPVNTLSYCLILYCIYFRNNIFLLAIGLSALFFNDERGIIAFSIIGLFILFWDKNELADIRSLVRDKSLLTLVGIFITCCAIRLTLQKTFDMHTPMSGVGIDVFLGQWKNFHQGLISGLAGFAILIVYALYIIACEQKYFLFLVTIAVVLFYIYAAAIVSDMSKSIAYLTPVALLLLKKIKDMQPDALRINGYTMIANTLYPTVVVVGIMTFYYYPVAYDIIFKALSLINR